MKKVIKSIIIATVSLFAVTTSAFAAEPEDTNTDFSAWSFAQAQSKMIELRDQYETAAANGDEDTMNSCIEIATKILDAQAQQFDAVSTRLPSPLNIYFDDVYWENRSDGTCLTIYPNTYLTGFHESLTIYDQSWAALKNHFSSDYRWKNESCLKKQYMCHCFYGRINIPWNIEPYKTSINPITCN